ncbi:hypothetical protein [Bacillus cereus]
MSRSIESAAFLFYIEKKEPVRILFHDVL